MTIMETLSSASRELFIALVNDASNWNDQPMFNGDKELRGNLTDLKKKGLLITNTEEGIIWIQFTKLGSEVAKKELNSKIEATAMKCEEGEWVVF